MNALEVMSMSYEFTLHMREIEAKVSMHTEDAGNTVEVYVYARDRQWPLALRTQDDGL